MSDCGVNRTSILMQHFFFGSRFCFLCHFACSSQHFHLFLSSLSALFLSIVKQSKPEKHGLGPWKAQHHLLSLPYFNLHWKGALSISFLIASAYNHGRRPQTKASVSCLDASKAIEPPLLVYYPPAERRLTHSTVVHFPTLSKLASFLKLSTRGSDLSTLCELNETNVVYMSRRKLTSCFLSVGCNIRLVIGSSAIYSSCIQSDKLRKIIIISKFIHQRCPTSKNARGWWNHTFYCHSCFGLASSEWRCCVLHALSLISKQQSRKRYFKIRIRHLNIENTHLKPQVDTVTHCKKVTKRMSAEHPRNGVVILPVRPYNI